jgi:hypothetical protein
LRCSACGQVKAIRAANRGKEGKWHIVHTSPQCKECTAAFASAVGLQVAAPQVDTEKGKIPMCFREQHVPENAVISHRICADTIRRPDDQIRGIYFVAGGCGTFTTSHVLFIL